MRDYDNDINEQRINTYTAESGGSGEAARWIAEFARRQVPVDLVWPSSDLRGYKVLVVPHLKITDKPLVEKLTQFAEHGGLLILGAQSGAKNRNCHVVEAVLPGLWRKHAGVEVEDWTTLPKGQTRTAKIAGGDGRTISLSTFVERLKPGRGVDVLASWQSDDPLVSGAPAMTRNKLGKGAIIYIGGYCPTEAIDTLADELLELAAINPLVDATPAVECIAREGGFSGKRRYLFLLNHSNKNEQVRGLPEKSKDLLTGLKITTGTLTLAPYGVAIVEA
jgi:beta-galactosidase